MFFCENIVYFLIGSLFALKILLKLCTLGLDNKLRATEQSELNRSKS